MPASSRAPRRLIIIVGSLVGVAALVLAGTWIYVNVLSDDAPDPFALDTSEAAEDTEPDQDVALDGTWTVGEDSEAGYRVDEVLNGIDTTVVGRTSDVSGEVVVEEGTASAAEITVDMTTVTTDSGSRDGQFRGSIMNTDEYPTSTFTLTEPVPLDELQDTDEPLTVSARGELTLRDVTREVDAELQMQLRGDSVQVAGSIPITFTDFAVDPPNLAFVRVEESGLVEFLLTLEPA